MRVESHGPNQWHHMEQEGYSVSRNTEAQPETATLDLQNQKVDRSQKLGL